MTLKCQTCGSVTWLPAPLYPVRVSHSCDLVEPGRALWRVLPEDAPAWTGDLA